MKKQIPPSLAHLFVLIVVALFALSPLLPLRVVPASAGLEKFSAERALVHLPIIAREQHRSGSPEQAEVRDYLIEQLKSLGLEVEVQTSAGAENVIARLKGSESGEAILVQAHYDSYGGPGAADNGAGVSALLEIMRALAASSKPKHDVIALFADSEEMPDPFTGTKAFVRNHPWMEEVRVAIGMDTAVRGIITTNDTGEKNGWMVKVLARAYTTGAWTSLSGGGVYDTQPFKIAGVRVLQLEDNYPFKEQHTEEDVPAIVRPGSLQQLGEQALAIVRAIDPLDLSNTSGSQRSYMYIPYIALLHYPQSWALPLAVIAGIFFIGAFWLALRNRSLSWKGIGVAFLVILSTALIAVLATGAFWKSAPGLLGWKTNLWSEWPEVIPPNGWLILGLNYLFVLVLEVIVYRIARRWSQPASFSFLGLFLFLLFALALAAAEPKAAILATWPVMIGALIWLIGLVLAARGRKVRMELLALIASIPATMYLLPLLPAIFMGDGTKSVSITAGAWVVVLALLLPGIDGLIARKVDQRG